MQRSSRANDAVKLIFSIVKKGMGSRVVRASRAAGAGGGTILIGRGTAKKQTKLLGIAEEPEKEIVLTMADGDLSDAILKAIAEEAKLNKPGEGIAFVLNLSRIRGVTHEIKSSGNAAAKEAATMDIPIKFDLIVSIVKYGYSEDVLAAARKAGAEGATIINGRGAGIHENAKLFNIPIEPEKEIILVLVPKEISENVLKAITDAVDLDAPGHGIAFVLDVEKAAGICHLYNLCDQCKQQE